MSLLKHARTGKNARNPSKYGKIQTAHQSVNPKLNFHTLEIAIKKLPKRCQLDVFGKDNSHPIHNFAGQPPFWSRSSDLPHSLEKEFENPPSNNKPSILDMAQLEDPPGEVSPIISKRQDCIVLTSKEQPKADHHWFEAG